MTSAAPSRDGQESLAALVEHLRAERDGLRAAMRTRALIEQAKGILMEQQRIAAEAAFDRLRDMSQRTNTRLAEVAAGIVAQVSPPPSAQGMIPSADPPRSATEPPAIVDGAELRPADAGVRDGLALHTQHLLVTARLESAGSYADVVAAVADTTLGWPRLGAVVLALADPDGALRIAASRGASADTVSQWTRIPPQVDVPLTAAARLLAPVWLADSDQVRRAYPLLLELTSQIAACVALPLLRDGRLLGVLGLTWRTSVSLDDSRRSYLTAAAEVVGRAVAGLTRSAPRTAGDPTIAGGTPSSWIQTVLDGSLDPAVLLTPVRVDGLVTDFMFDCVNQPATEAAAAAGLPLPGTTVLTAMPDIGARVLLPLFRAVLADGDTRQLDDLPVGAPGRGSSGCRQTVRAVRLGQAVVVSWRTHTAADVIYEDMVAAGRTAGIAAFRWQLSANELSASPNLRALIDWPAGPPPTPQTVWQAVDPTHWSAVRKAAVDTLRTGAPLTLTLVTRRGQRWLRVMGERLTDSAGRPVALRGFVQDIGGNRTRGSHAHRLAEARPGDRRRTPAPS